MLASSIDLGCLYAGGRNRGRTNSTQRSCRSPTSSKPSPPSPPATYALLRMHTAYFRFYTPKVACLWPMLTKRPGATTLRRAIRISQRPRMWLLTLSFLLAPLAQPCQPSGYNRYSGKQAASPCVKRSFFDRSPCATRRPLDRQDPPTFCRLGGVLRDSIIIGIADADGTATISRLTRGIFPPSER